MLNLKPDFRILLGSLLACVTVLATVPATLASLAEGGVESPQSVVRDAAEKLEQVISEGKTYYAQDSDRFYRAVESVLSPFVDFAAISRSVMAIHSRKASPEQKAKFADTFKWGLVRTYAGALIDSEETGIVVLDPDKPPRNPKRQGVKMEITTTDGQVYPVIYAMVQGKDGVWKMRNIIINGINLGLTYRNQFASAMRDGANAGDLDKVIEGWAEIISDVESIGVTDAREAKEAKKE